MTNITSCLLSYFVNLIKKMLYLPVSQENVRNNEINWFNRKHTHTHKKHK